MNYYMPVKVCDVCVIKKKSKMMAGSINILLCGNIDGTKNQLLYIFCFTFCLTKQG